MIFLTLLTLKFVTASLPVVDCPGATGGLSDFCNSDLSNVGIEPAIFVMGSSQVSSYAVETPVNGTQYLAAQVFFFSNVPIKVRVWDAYVSADYFQLSLSDSLFPEQTPKIITPINYRLIKTTSEFQSAFGSGFYAWTEFILMEPSTWTLKIWVTRTTIFVSDIGIYVQQFIQTIPYSPPTSCPFN